MKKIVIFALTILMSGLMANAQQKKPNISFSETIYDFGNIQEKDGKVSYVFKFKNTGQQPLVVHDVKASCGCTSPEWTRNPIPAGGSGEVKAVFDPANRPGNFNKTITVYSNAENSNVVLRITGNVTEKPITDTELYPNEMGLIRLESAHLAFTKMEPKQTKTEQLKIMSSSDKAVTIKFDNVPEHIKIKAVPEVLNPGQKGIITATYDANLKNDWGFVVDNVYVMFNGERDYKNRLTISASIEEDFAKLTPDQLAKAAVCEISETTWDFGTIKQGAEVSHDFVVKNTGKSELIIRKVKASCGCTATSPQKTVLAPGESTKISTVFDSKGKSGSQNKSVTVVTNDPKNTTQMLRITGTISME